MEMFVCCLLFAVGVVLVIKGGDAFVDAASWIARAMNIPTFIIGATIVSLATTMPEMIVSVMAAAQGKVDMAISGFAYTAERAENMQLSTFFNFSEDENGQGLLVLKEKTGDYTTAEAFSGKTIAAQNASLQYNLVTSQLPADVKVKLITNLNDAIMMLVTGKVDAVAVDADNGALFAGNYDSIAMADFHFDYSSEGNVLAVTKGETELIEAINKILDEVNEKGLYKQWKDDATELAKSLGIDVN